MALTTLKLTRKHGYGKHVPASQPELATFRSVKPEDPSAQRPFDKDGVALDLKPAPENVEHLMPAWQHIGVYRSDDGRYEVSIELTASEAESPPAEISVDFPL